MKKILQRISRLTFVMPVSLVFCSWDNPGMYSYPNRVIAASQVIADTLPKTKQDQIDKAMKELDVNLSKLNVEMKDLNINLDKQLQSLADIDIDAIQKQTEASLKQIDWNKMQQDVNVSVEKAQNEIAKIDFSKMQKDMQALQEKFQSEAFKSQFNSEKLHKDIQESMKNAKAGIEKAKQQLQHLKAFTDALAEDGLIDKKKGYTIEWKSGELYINNQKQSKNISDKYRKYESSGKIKMEPDGVEHL
jgi:hypothetical protein